MSVTLELSQQKMTHVYNNCNHAISNRNITLRWKETRLQKQDKANEKEKVGNGNANPFIKSKHNASDARQRKC